LANSNAVAKVEEGELFEVTTEPPDGDSGVDESAGEVRGVLDPSWLCTSEKSGIPVALTLDSENERRFSAAPVG
jgi:hypothetical protein